MLGQSGSLASMLAACFRKPSWPEEVLLHALLLAQDMVA
jgi:hypothetical protein